MVRRTTSRIVAGCFAAAFGVAGELAAAAAPDPIACWRELEFTAGTGLASASTTIRFRDQPQEEAQGQLFVPERKGTTPLPAAALNVLISARFDAMLSHGEMDTWYDATNARVLQTIRTGNGRESRRKLHRFLTEGVWRERRAPEGAATGVPPERWPLRSQSLLPFPPGRAVEPQLTPLLLLVEAARLATGTQSVAGHLVLSDTHFYHVTLRAGPTRPDSSEWQLQYGDEMRPVEGARTVRRVKVDETVVDGDPAEDPMRLLELEGDLAITVDTYTGVPIRVEGDWMRVGTVTANLARARLDPACVR